MYFLMYLPNSFQYYFITSALYEYFWIQEHFKFCIFQVLTQCQFYDTNQIFQEEIIDSLIGFINYGYENRCTLPSNTLHLFIIHISHFLFELKDSKVCCYIAFMFWQYPICILQRFSFFQVLTPLFGFLITSKNIRSQSLKLCDCEINHKSSVLPSQ